MSMGSGVWGLAPLPRWRGKRGLLDNTDLTSSGIEDQKRSQKRPNEQRTTSWSVRIHDHI